ncbi:hypothetical protein GGX14DRAFT_415910 [Mycena pura]|uniref:Uncharacterized protein n=1 Tax=Mycena pura TaxID=153505 RepID=A0AAD7E510_9AGAR|nr:hypothetical protein GGX14DRAFT_415910 [Mycena pura]
MPRGELPITSYFTRVPQKKRKASAALRVRSAPAKRKRLDDGLQLETSLSDASEIPQHTVNLESTRRSASPKSTRLASPHLVSGASASCRHRTSPPTIRVGKTRDSRGKSVAFASTASVHAIDLTLDSEDETSIVPSSQSQLLRSPERPQSSLPESGDDFFVPSSQSQYMLPPQLPRRKDTASTDFVPSSQSQSMTPLIPPVQDDDGFVVPSSQSQWLLPMQSQAEHNRLFDMAAGVSDDEIIPTSQSQFEIELPPRSTTRTPNRRNSSGEPGFASSSPQSYSQPNVDRGLDLAEIFENSLPAMDLATPLNQDNQDSATESDEDAPTMMPVPSVSDLASPHPSRERYDFESYSASQSGFTAPRGAADEDFGSAESAGSSLGSLPGVVKDFYEMFGGNGSYPQSFPESLRGTYTQDE